MGARLAVVGLGTVGSWLLRAIERGEAGEVEVVLATSGRDGAEGALASTGFDVLVDAVNSPEGGEPGAGLIRGALTSGAHVVTSDKWPVALHGVEFAASARERGLEFRAESTVMSGTPVLAPLLRSLEGDRAVAARGIVNATVNRILTDMGAGSAYEDALAHAQARGLAEPDPAADVGGRDEVAKAMILAGLAFGIQLAPAEVSARGVSELTSEERDAVAAGETLRSVTTLARAAGGGVDASVGPEVLGADDALRGVDGVDNALVVRTAAGDELRFRGPGAGPEIAGKGVLDDLREVLRAGGRRSDPPAALT